MDWTEKKYWLVGASEGLGAALARQLSRAGAHVVLSARSQAQLQALAEELPGPVTVQPLDVTDHSTVAEAAKAIGALDGVVFLAGVYWPMGAKSWKAEQALAMADVNFSGLVRVMSEVVPAFVAKDCGHIVITGSLSGFRGLPGSIGYSASKAGCMSLAECLYADLRRTNVRVQLVNPGFIRTRLTDKNTFSMPFIMEPDDAARRIFEHMQTDRFSTSFPWLFSSLFRAAQFLPDWLYYRLF